MRLLLVRHAEAVPRGTPGIPDDERPLLTITKALLTAEIDICYMYPLLTGVGPMGNTAIAVYVHDFEAAAAALEGQGFTLFTENDLRE